MSKRKAIWSIVIAALLFGGAAIIWFGFKKPGSIQDKDLIEASRSGDYEGAKRALEAGANVNFREGKAFFDGAKASFESGYTALHYAAERGNTKIVQLLVENGADINAKNDFGNTPLLLAINFSMKDTVVYLLANGADVNVRNKDGAGAIAHADKRLASPLTLEILKIVKDAGAKP